MTARDAAVRALREALDAAGDWIVSTPYNGPFGPERQAVLAKIDAAEALATPAATASIAGEGLRDAIDDLHRWDVSRGWPAFNAILARIDAALSTPASDFPLDAALLVRAAKNVNERERLLDGWTIERIARAIAREYVRLSEKERQSE